MSPGIAGVNNLGTTSRDPENVSRPFALIPLSLYLYTEWNYRWVVGLGMSNRPFHGAAKNGSNKAVF